MSQQPPQSPWSQPAGELLARAVEPLQGVARPLAKCLEDLEERFAARRSLLIALWVAAVVAMLALRFVNLRADYPLDYPTAQAARVFLRDGFLYTDEGWYAASALRWFRTGDWYLAGDLNFAVVLPLHSLMHGASFALLGPTIEGARVTGLAAMLFACWFTFLLVRRFEAAWVGLLAVSLMATNLFFFAHNRLAIGENAIMAWMMAAALAATHAKDRRAWAMAALAGVLLVAGTLTKTPAILVAPFLALGIVANNGWRSTRGWGAGTLFGVIVLGGYLAWGAVVARSFAADVAFFNAINVDMRLINDAYAFFVTAYFFYYHLVFVDRLLYWVVLAGVPTLLVLSPRLRAHPLAPACYLLLLWWFLVFTLYGNRQCRYFVAMGPPVAILLAVVMAAVWRARACSPLQRVAAWALAIAFAATMVHQATLVAVAMSFPRFSTAEAAHWIKSTMRCTPGANNVLVGHTSCTLALYEDFVPVNDLYVTAPLGERLDAMRPRFLIAEYPVDVAPWAVAEELTDRDPRSVTRRLAELEARYRMVELARPRILRNDAGREFRFYRLDPLEADSGS